MALREGMTLDHGFWRETLSSFSAPPSISWAMGRLAQGTVLVAFHDPMDQFKREATKPSTGDDVERAGSVGSAHFTILEV